MAQAIVPASPVTEQRRQRPSLAGIILLLSFWMVLVACVVMESTG